MLLESHKQFGQLIHQYWNKDTGKDWYACAFEQTMVFKNCQAEEQTTFWTCFWDVSGSDGKSGWKQRTNETLIKYLFHAFIVQWFWLIYAVVIDCCIFVIKWILLDLCLFLIEGFNLFISFQLLISCYEYHFKGQMSPTKKSNILGLWENQQLWVF